ncbi:MAG: TetR/AcrR family transcriptional regulator [Calditerrivibrio sp.]|nr:TetR/AcrR family transcriptional regulator [Calditerrivibrio sp.]MCA1932810.1 TetR/AcrR family transcriptional regulator [Calditerrivibrio sp.]MCA1980230.1 TetR/AcrR family transcriptional regulator [Calditerrivibrio sp.]
MTKHSIRDKRELLINSAVDVFSEKGYWNTKISDIVSKAGVAQGTFYLYFKNKEQLFKEMLLELHKASVEEINSITEKKYKNSLDKLIEMLINKFYARKKIIKVFIYETLSVGNEFIEILEHFKNVSIHFIAECLKIDYPDMDNEKIAKKSFIIYSIIRNIMEFSIIRENKPLKDTIYEAKSLISEVL